MKGLVILLFMILSIQIGACQGATRPTGVDNEQGASAGTGVALEQTTEATETAEPTRAEPLQTPTTPPTPTPRITATPPGSRLQIGDPAPDFTLPTLNGEEVSFQDFRGKAILLNFWASWCGPCRFETPDLQRLYEKYQDQDFVVIGVSVDEEDTVDSVPDFIEEFSLTYPILLDTDLQISTKYEGSYYSGGIPKSYFIDAEGIIRDISEGALEWDFMEGKTLRLLDPEAGELRLAALELVTEGRDLARAGDIEGATAKFQDALMLDPSLDLDDPEAEAKQVAALELVQQGQALASEGQVEEAMAAYEEAQALDPTLEIPAQYWNNLCWFGSLWGYAAEVLEICEQGVELAGPEREAGNRDSRGLARALTGDYAGAIEDFEIFVAWTKETGQYDSYGAKREAWIAELEAGRNPFDEETLEELRNE